MSSSSRRPRSSGTRSARSTASPRCGRSSTGRVGSASATPMSSAATPGSSTRSRAALPDGTTLTQQRVISVRDAGRYVRGADARRRWPYVAGATEQVVVTMPSWTLPWIASTPRLGRCGRGQRWTPPASGRYVKVLLRLRAEARELWADEATGPVHAAHRLARGLCLSQADPTTPTQTSSSRCSSTDITPRGSTACLRTRSPSARSRTSRL